jgi:hypothetical protein
LMVEVKAIAFGEKSRIISMLADAYKKELSPSKSDISLSIPSAYACHERLSRSLVGYQIRSCCERSARCFSDRMQHGVSKEKKPSSLEGDVPKRYGCAQIHQGARYR